MKIAHRLRMFFLLRHADNLLRHASARRAYLNRPHQQSVHLVSYPVPKRPYLWLARLYAVTLVVLFALAVYVNTVDAEPMQVAACTRAGAR